MIAHYRHVTWESRIEIARIRDGAGIGRRSREGWGCTGLRSPESWIVVRGNQNVLTRICARICATGSTRVAGMNVFTSAVSTTPGAGPCGPFASALPDGPRPAGGLGDFCVASWVDAPGDRGPFTLRVPWRSTDASQCRDGVFVDLSASTTTPSTSTIFDSWAPHTQERTGKTSAFGAD